VFNCLSGEVHKVDLPVRSYSYAYQYAEECSENITITGKRLHGAEVISIYSYSTLNIVHPLMIIFTDYRMKRRLDFVAKYNIKCSELSESGIKSFLLSLARNKDKEIQFICSSGTVIIAVEPDFLEDYLQLING
jgi:hypothetical protein